MGGRGRTRSGPGGGGPRRAGEREPDGEVLEEHGHLQEGNRETRSR